MSLEMAQSGGPGISASAPLSGGKQTSGERVENDANDPQRTLGGGPCFGDVRPDRIERQYEDNGPTAQSPSSSDGNRSDCRSIWKPYGVADESNDDKHRDSDDRDPASARQRARRDGSTTHRIDRAIKEQHRDNDCA